MRRSPQAADDDDATDGGSPRRTCRATQRFAVIADIHPGPIEEVLIAPAAVGACRSARLGSLDITIVIGHYAPVEGRPINEHEVTLAAAFLAPPLDGFKELRVQIPSATVVPGCACGCGTIDFIFDEFSVDLPRSTATNPIPWSPDIVDDDGNVIGSLILFLRNGLLQSLEVVSYGDPLPLPEVLIRSRATAAKTLDRVDWAAAP